MRPHVILALLTATLAPATAFTDEAATPTPPPTPTPVVTAPEEPKPLGLTIELCFATNYIFRGLNVFGNGQLDAHTMFSPGVTYAVPGTGLTLGYWGAFQLNGDNVGTKLASALGGENDLWFNYNVGLPQDFALDLGITSYFYPFAKEATVGAAYPVFLEPRVGASWNGPVTLSLNVMYFLGLQDTAAIRGASYLYLLPKVSKLVPLHPKIGLDLSLSYGWKYFIHGNDGLGNTHDVMAKVGLPVRPWGRLYVTPGIGAAWTNVLGGDTGDGFAVYGFVNMGVEL